MDKLGLNQLRQMFIDFFVSKDHYAGGSASLIPRDDKSLMIINSGMAPLKPYFAGVETPPAHRMTTCQKCIRTNDIENVGKTARHGTFFEMLGNFSFGDYFKKESLNWGWEFITEWLNMPVDKLWATIYEDDDQAYEIWKEIGMPEDRIVRLGKEDNFWEIGLGPCGPCSEIYFDRGEEYGCGHSDCKPGCDCDRYIEFWNHVFTQFSKEEDGSYSNLEHPNIDTGMGLERLACIMQGVDSIFDIDTIKHILDAVVEMSGVKYQAGNDKNDTSIRIITDHLRSMVFMIGDGILPSNEGRGYILRRIIRRALRHGKLLGIEQDNCLTILSNKVMEVSGGAYPEIIEKKDYIQKIIRIEEEKFAKTLDKGISILDGYIKDIQDHNTTILDGEHAFKLYDTYGFPIELTAEILEESGLSVDMDGFTEHMKQQKELARAGRKSTEEEAWRDASEYSNLPPTIFVGYEIEAATAKVQYIGDYDQTRKFIIFDKTPFYATSGGQQHDIGYITIEGKSIRVVDVVKENGIYLHICDADDSGLVFAIKPGDEVNLAIDSIRRHKTARNHSATHLLQKALREVLGDHVMQAGSYVDEKYLRFDFNHFEPISADKLQMIQEIVNSSIDQFMPVTMQEMSIGEAKKIGAMAIFGEKYGNVVRVVNMGDYSIELCGGTHVDNTGKIGGFKITGEYSVASGVRRIEAITGSEIVNRIEQKELLIHEVSNALKSNDVDIARKASQLQTYVKTLENQIKELKSEEISGSIDEILASAKQIKEVRLITQKFENMETEQLRNICDSIKAAHNGIVMLFASVTDDKVTYICSVSEDLLGKGYHAGKIIKEVAAAAGGGGGGKANMAQAGAKDPDKVSLAFAKVEEILSC